MSCCSRNLAPIDHFNPITVCYVVTYCCCYYISLYDPSIVFLKLSFSSFFYHSFVLSKFSSFVNHCLSSTPSHYILILFSVTVSLSSIIVFASYVTSFPSKSFSLSSFFLLSSFVISFTFSCTNSVLPFPPLASLFVFKRILSSYS